MIKKEIRSGVKKTLPQIDKTSKYHDRYIDFCIETVLNEIYQEVHDANPLDLQRFTKRYGTVTPISVTLDSSAGIYYSNYPAKICVINDKASGVRRISTIAQVGMTFFPLDIRELEYMLSGTYSNTVNTKIGYVPTQDRIEYHDMTVTTAAAGVRMDLLIPFSVYLDTDTVLIPEGVNAQGESFMDRVLKILGVVQPIDLTDNNSDIKIKKQTNG